MKKAVYLTLLTIVTIICILFGVFYHVLGRIAGNGFRIFTKGYYSSEQCDFSEQIDEFTSIQMDIAAAEVMIEKGDAFSIAYEGIEDLKPQYSVDNKVLNVKSSTKGIHFTTSIVCKLTVTIPEGTKLNGVVFDIDAGNLEAYGLNADKLEIDVDAGNVEVYDAACDRVTIDVDAGNVIFKDGELGSVEASADMGNIEFKSCAFDILEAEADMGNVEVHSSQSLEDYSMNIDVDLGNVDVNGHDYSGGYTSAGDSDHRIDITVSLGNAEITY